MRRLALVAVLAAALTVVAAPAAHATGNVKKSFTMVVAPASVPAGTKATFTATLTNRSSHNKLDSADITVPSAFTGISVADLLGKASATLYGNVIKVRDVKLDPGKSVAVTATATVPCAPGTHTWAVKAKHYALLGSGEGDLTLDASAGQLKTTVTGSCALRFVAGHTPANARVGQTISAAEYDPAGPVLQVEVVDGDGSRVTTSSAVVSIALGPRSGSGTLAGTTTATASAGVASFANLSISGPGTYTLTASSTGFASVTSGSFMIDQVAVPCIEDQACSATLANGQTNFDVTAAPSSGTDAGFLVMSNNVGPSFDCDNYKEQTATPTTIVGPDRTKTVTATIDRSVLNAQHRSYTSVQMCFGAPYPFTTRYGSTLKSIDTNGDGSADFYFGLLPDCGTAPCVAKRKQNDDCDAVIVVKAPGGSKDPAYRP
jgi:hypothetical protein